MAISYVASTALSYTCLSAWYSLHVGNTRVDIQCVNSTRYATALTINRKSQPKEGKKGNVHYFGPGSRSYAGQGVANSICSIEMATFLSSSKT